MPIRPPGVFDVFCCLSTCSLLHINQKIKQLTASNMLLIMKPNNQEKEKLLVRIFREELGLTRYDVRQATGIAERTLADIESGKSIPNADNIIALARLYKKSLKILLAAMKLDVSGIPDDLNENRKLKN